MTDEGHHRRNGAERAGPAVVDERSLLGRKPILEWTREDWQLWAAGLTDPAQPDLAELDEPETQPTPVDDLHATGLPAGDLAADDPPADDPPKVAQADARSAEAKPRRPDRTGTMTREASRPVAVEPRAELAAKRLSRPPVTAPADHRRARSVLGLVVLAVAVGTTVAGLITASIVVGGLILRRAFG